MHSYYVGILGSTVIAAGILEYKHGNLKLFRRQQVTSG